MKYQCDTAGEVGACGGCDHGHDHEIIPFKCRTKRGPWFSCPATNTVVHCNPIAPSPACSVCAAEKKHFQESLFGEMARRIYSPRPKTHTCYFCDHTGQDVNRIAIYLGIRSTDYCCDDAVACDERWQQLGDAGITARREERLSQLAHQVEPWLEHEQSPDDDLRQKIYAIIEEEVLNHMTSERMAIDSTNRIMKLIELLF